MQRSQTKDVWLAQLLLEMQAFETGLYFLTSCVRMVRTGGGLFNTKFKLLLAILLKTSEGILNEKEVDTPPPCD